MCPATSSQRTILVTGARPWPLLCSPNSSLSSGHHGEAAPSRTGQSPAGVRDSAFHSCAQAPGGFADAQDADRTRLVGGTKARRRTGPQGQRLRDRTRSPTLDPRPSQRRRADGGSDVRRRGWGEFGLRHGDDRDHEASVRHGRQPQPHHPAARCRRRRTAETRHTFLEGSTSRSEWRCWTANFTSATPTGSSPTPTPKARRAFPAKAETSPASSRWPMDSLDPALPGWSEALYRRRLAFQHRRRRDGGRGRARRDLRTRHRHRRHPHLRVRPAQSRRPRVGARDCEALDRRQRTRRARRRDAAGLPHLGRRRSLLRLALVLLEQDRR